MKNLVKDNFTLLKKCGKTLVIFELIYKMVAVAMFYPLFLLLFNISLKLAGIKYLTNGYILRYFTNPFTIIMIILLVLLIAVYNFFEKCCISVLIEAGVIGEKVNVLNAFYAGSLNFRAKFRIRNVSLIL